MNEILLKLLLAAICGGVLCVIAQLLIDLTKLTPARILVLYVSLGVLIYAVGLYEPLYDIFGVGMSLPLIGFGANIGRGVKEAVDSTGALGILTGGIGASAGGITLALVLGLLASLIFKPRSKRM
ncbi:MAG: SpoVA/SpoVAEb family sporulation membrane protein [Clostridia bacterium]|nr:SpoVA/SpoVAEb family sporulation membrane protein [Clostridia bacterium]